ncbi:AraC family transcriptional regulator [Sphaerothrix gracilis]
MERTEAQDAAIALECGFDSPSHLGRKFRHLTGMTPKAYHAQ